MALPLDFFSLPFSLVMPTKLVAQPFHFYLLPLILVAGGNLQEAFGTLAATIR